MEMYHYTECGLPNVWLTNGFCFKDTPYGRMVSFADLKGLHKLIGDFLINKPGPLLPEEIRFLRKELKLSQAALARAIGVAEISVRKWEKGDNNINRPAERLLKLLYKEYVEPNSPVTDLVDKLAELDSEVQQSNPLFSFEFSHNYWRRKSNSPDPQITR